jgi:hypothetical protein
MIAEMKRKLFKILCVVAVITILVSVLIAPVAADINGVSLTVGDTTISTATPYQVTFTLGSTQTANTAAIVVTFATGMVIGSPSVTIQAGPGTGTPAISLTTITADTTIAGQTATINTLAGSVPIGTIGAGALVKLTFTNIINPSIAGNYNVSVSTSSEPNAVASNTFTTTYPSTGGPLPGVASIYDSKGILIIQYNSLNSALNYAITNNLSGATIKLTASTYTDLNTNTPYVFTNAITIQGTDPSVANVIIEAAGNWFLTGTTVIIDSVTVDGRNGVLTLSASKSATVSNSIIQNNALVIGATGTGTSAITDDTFNVKTSATGLAVTSATTITGSTFNLTGQSGYGISAPFDVTVASSTFTGTNNTMDRYLGNGILVSGSVNGSSISSCTFTGLSNALTVDGAGAMATFSSNTVNNCGQTLASGNSTAAIIVGSAAANGVSIFNNTFTNGSYYIVNVTTANTVNVSQNTFIGNAKTAQSADTNATLNMARNWWGGSTNVPANVTLVIGTTAGITYTPALGCAPSSSIFAVVGASATNPIIAVITVGVNITASSGAGMVGATALSANPVSAAIPSADVAVKYWDVYGVQFDGKTAITSATVDFYGTTATPVTSMNSSILFYNATNGTWINTNASANVNGNYMEIRVGTGGNITAAQFTGTPFVLVTSPIALGGGLGNIGGNPGPPPLYPVNGQIDVPINDVTFTWPAVSGTSVTYQFVLSQASTNTSSNEFAYPDYTDYTSTNAEPSKETLQYNTEYWWEVRTVGLDSSGNIVTTGPWSIQTFTTIAGTTTSIHLQLTEITTNTSTVAQTQTNIIFVTPPGSYTHTNTPYAFWAIIVICATLVIVAIFLIVIIRRTR